MDYYYLNDAYLSNFRTANAVNDVASAVLRIKDKLSSDEAYSILWSLLTAQMQSSYTGRCLGGIISPNKTNKTDQRERAREALKLMEKIKKNNEPDEGMLFELMRQLVN